MASGSSVRPLSAASGASKVNRSHGPSAHFVFLDQSVCGRFPIGADSAAQPKNPAFSDRIRDSGIPVQSMTRDFLMPEDIHSSFRGSGGGVPLHTGD